MKHRALVVLGLLQLTSVVAFGGPQGFAKRNMRGYLVRDANGYVTGIRYDCNAKYLNILVGLPKQKKIRFKVESLRWWPWENEPRPPMTSPAPDPKWLEKNYGDPFPPDRLSGSHIKWYLMRFADGTYTDQGGFQLGKEYTFERKDLGTSFGFVVNDDLFMDNHGGWSIMVYGAPTAWISEASPWKGDEAGVIIDSDGRVTTTPPHGPPPPPPPPWIECEVTFVSDRLPGRVTVTNTATGREGRWEFSAGATCSEVAVAIFFAAGGAGYKSDIEGNGKVRIYGKNIKVHTQSATFESKSHD